MIASFEIIVPHAGQGISLDSVVVVSVTAWAGSTFFVVAAVGAAGVAVVTGRGAGMDGIGVGAGEVRASCSRPRRLFSRSVRRFCSSIMRSLAAAIVSSSFATRCSRARSSWPRWIC